MGLIAGVVVLRRGPSPERWVRVIALAEQGKPRDGIALGRAGGVHRPVLAVAPEAKVLRAVAGADAPPLDVAVPPALRGKPLCVAGVVRHTGEPPATAVVAGPVLASAGATERVALPRDPALYPAFTDLRVRQPSAGRQEFEITSVPERARLRVGIGLEEHPLLAEQDAARFRVVLVGAEGDRELLAAELVPRVRAGDRGWRDYEVDLGAFAGRPVRLRFETETPAGPDCRRLPYPLWADPVIVAPQRLPRRPNVLLISLDTLRADRLGTYGYAKPTSPTIDHVLAAQGTVFARAFSAFPSTAGSHMTMLTSLDPCAHGVRNVSDPPLRPDARTLAELLREAGYATAAFTEDGQITTRLGFPRGFDVWVERHALEHAQAASTFRRAREWIRAHRRDPWFAFVHTYEVHEPYAPPPGYREMLTAEDAPSARYDGEIRYTDDLLAVLLDKLRRAGALAHTLVIVTSDHGEQFGEHGLHGHGNSLYDVLLHVPLVLWGPGLVPAGRRVTRAVGLVDLVPTVTDLLGLPPPPLTQGRSLVPLLEGRALPPRVLVAENVGAPLAVRHDDTSERKLLPRPDRPIGAAFLAATDPGELHDVAGTLGSAAFAEARRLFDAHCAAIPPPPPGAAAPPLDPAVQEKLRALGYAQ